MEGVGGHGRSWKEERGEGSNIIIVIYKTKNFFAFCFIKGTCLPLIGAVGNSFDSSVKWVEYPGVLTGMLFGITESGYINLLLTTLLYVWHAEGEPLR